jgi:hypothetical protein
VPDAPPNEVPEAPPDEVPDEPPDEVPDEPPDGMPDEPPDGMLDEPPDEVPDEPPDGLPDEPPDGVPDTPPEVPLPPVPREPVLPGAQAAAKKARHIPTVDRSLRLLFITTVFYSRNGRFAPEKRRRSRHAAGRWWLAPGALSWNCKYQSGLVRHVNARQCLFLGARDAWFAWDD